MTFLETRPVPIQEADVGIGGVWAAFRVDSERQRQSVFRSLVSQQATLSVGLPGGGVLPAHLWSCDADTGALSVRLARREHRSRLAGLPGRGGPAGLAPNTVWAATYLGHSKLQFDLPNAELADPQGHPVLRATRPQLLLELPRRSDARVHCRVQTAPVARFRHPLAPDQAVSLRLLDLGLSGCALWRPRGLVPIAPGMRLHCVEVELDDESIFFSDLDVVSARLGHRSMQTLPMGQADGMRLGCAWVDLPPQAREMLDDWLRRGRLRRARVALDDDGLERFLLD